MLYLVTDDSGKPEYKLNKPISEIDHSGDYEELEVPWRLFWRCNDCPAFWTLPFSTYFIVFTKLCAGFTKRHSQHQ